MKLILMVLAVMTSLSAWALLDVSNPQYTILEIQGYIPYDTGTFLHTAKNLAGVMHCDGAHGENHPVVTAFNQSSGTDVADYEFSSKEDCEKADSLIRQLAVTKKISMSLNNDTLKVEKITEE